MSGLILLASAGTAFAQAPVTAVAVSEPLFTSPDPAVHRNKQAAYHICRDLLEAGHWELADKWLTERYIQHNPITAVVAEKDYVIVIAPRVLKDPADPGKSYSIAWFDMWRFVDGKADEHWDGAMKGDIF